MINWKGDGRRSRAIVGSKRRRLKRDGTGLGIVKIIRRRMVGRRRIEREGRRR